MRRATLPLACRNNHLIFIFSGDCDEIICFDTHSNKYHASTMEELWFDSKSMHESQRFVDNVRFTNVISLDDYQSNFLVSGTTQNKHEWMGMISINDNNDIKWHSKNGIVSSRIFNRTYFNGHCIRHKNYILWFHEPGLRIYEMNHKTSKFVEILSKNNVFHYSPCSAILIKPLFGKHEFHTMDPYLEIISFGIPYYRWHHTFESLIIQFKENEIIVHDANSEIVVCNGLIHQHPEFHKMNESWHSYGVFVYRNRYMFLMGGMKCDQLNQSLYGGMNPTNPYNEHAIDTICYYDFCNKKWTICKETLLAPIASFKLVHMPYTDELHIFGGLDNWSDFMESWDTQMLWPNVMDNHWIIKLPNLDTDIVWYYQRRLLWIAFEKNQHNKTCSLANLPKVLIIDILKLL